ncbi:acyl homoserine lactone synthase [Yoonia maritima]|uniref:Acyl-homoserine-lactone synthase n=1 Tax=Yoonia maritima TaxID=1435347 RepID=A0A2T0W2K9_9RHOB|nr:acyl-homoserine-lactone synthase [Yoonia maritima]PRY79398.1 acyl homoserine lactone synthase [Yoonia maritima]
MLRYIYGNDLSQFPVLQDTMHRDRATQFSERLKWAVHVDDNGWERDEYDAMNPLYVIWENADGTHGGSMRFLPTSEQTMVNDHFSDLLKGEKIESPFIWECTRFVLGAQATPRVAAAMMLAGGELMRAFSLTHLLGVFDPRMVRIYSMIGASPEVLGSSGEGRDKISVGLWAYRPEDRVRVLLRAEVSSDVSESWFDLSFGRSIQQMQKVA